MNILDIMYIVLIAVAVLVAIFKGVSLKEKAENFENVPTTVKNRIDIARKYSEMFDVPLKWIMGVIWTENNGNMLPDGESGEKGIMQIKEIAYKDTQLEGLPDFPKWRSDPEHNIATGTEFLSIMKKRQGTWKEAIRAYNQGGKGKEIPGRDKLADDYYQKVLDKSKFFG